VCERERERERERLKVRAEKEKKSGREEKLEKHFIYISLIIL
jgi:hypothetical protein